MRYLRNTLLLSVAALVAMAFAASSASALNPNLEIKDEDTLVHCPAVQVSANEQSVTGGCLIHATSNSSFEDGESELRKHVFGIESHITTCKWELYARIDEAGEGYIFEQTLATVGPNHGTCNRKPCSHNDVEGARDPWPAHGREIAVANEVLRFHWCITDLVGHTQREECTIDVPFRPIPSSHKFEFGTLSGGHPVEMPGADGAPGFRCEPAGHWLTETQAGTGPMG